jgi:hypothetical protein
MSNGTPGTVQSPSYPTACNDKPLDAIGNMGQSHAYAKMSIFACVLFYGLLTEARGVGTGEGMPTETTGWEDRGFLFEREKEKRAIRPDRRRLKG